VFCFQAEDGIRDFHVTGVQTCALPICGVGKSTVTVNLAAALRRLGHAVGVLDADIYGFSVPRMLGLEGKPTAIEGKIMPMPAYEIGRASCRERVWSCVETPTRSAHTDV